MISCMRGYYFITDAKLTKANIERDTVNAIAGGATVVQYRQKTGPSAVLYAEALKLKVLCKDACFIVNDRIDIALAVDADGVHIGPHDLPLPVVRRLMPADKLIGVSVTSLAAAREAAAAGATYLGVGPVFATNTKADAGPPLGLSLLREIRQACDLPLVAIGGITHANAPDVIAAGADMVCAISAVVSAPDVRQAVSDFQRHYAA